MILTLFAVKNQIQTLTMNKTIALIVAVGVVAVLIVAVLIVVCVVVM